MRYDLSQLDAGKIAGLTDMRVFYQQLRPILVQRIVDTAQHRDVGNVSLAKKLAKHLICPKNG